MLRLILVLALSSLAFASGVTCALHYNAPCYGTGQVRGVNGRQFELYHCSCGDEYWVPQ